MIARQQYLTESLLAYIDERLRDAGYGPEEFVILESFPYERIANDTTIDNTYIATGFNYTDRARRIEMGSTLSRRPITFEIFVFAPSDENAGENVTGIIEQVLEREYIPILDVALEVRPQIDMLELLSVTSARQPVPKPRPWEENVHVVTLRAEDEYYAEE